MWQLGSLGDGGIEGREALALSGNSIVHQKQDPSQAIVNGVHSERQRPFTVEMRAKGSTQGLNYAIPAWTCSTISDMASYYVETSLPVNT